MLIMEYDCNQDIVIKPGQESFFSSIDFSIFIYQFSHLLSYYHYHILCANTTTEDDIIHTILVLKKNSVKIKDSQVQTNQHYNSSCDEDLQNSGKNVAILYKNCQIQYMYMQSRVLRTLDVAVYYGFQSTESVPPSTFLSSAILRCVSSSFACAVLTTALSEAATNRPADKSSC